MKDEKRILSAEQSKEILSILKERFEKNMFGHRELEWSKVNEKLEANPQKLWSLYQMEASGGEPDLIEYDIHTDEYIFYDCATESPTGRRSFCYDQLALDLRKANKPANSAVGMADEMGIELLTEE